ncbi:MAG TPA: sigma-70 family RNA polymerase sigma factor [Vicinamibacterales bacterium]|nr:sigma-70 family RNA polymerase sigma factor [Vicinamibacterales bacterium]
MEPLNDLVFRARRGDVAAYGRLVQTTERMVFGVAFRVLHDEGLAEDAAQETYLRAFRRIGSLGEDAAFLTWLRRIAVTVAINMRRSRRTTFLRLDDGVDIPILDEIEARWSDAQRQQLAAALLILTPEERRLCDRRYHGGWTIARLARDAGVDDAAMRKRMQRIRDRLRKDIEMSEQSEIRTGQSPHDLPARIIELLSRPQLTNLPENPVGQVTQILRGVFSQFVPTDLPEFIDFAAARQAVTSDAIYVEESELHHVDDRRILRYDMTLPLLMTRRYEGQPMNLWIEGKVYRQGRLDAKHLEAFHQAEVFWLGNRGDVDGWRMTTMMLQSVDAILPGATVRIVPTTYAMCSQAWELEVEFDGQLHEVSAWGVFTDRILRHIGADPAKHVAVGAGYGLERLAALRYGIDDIRKIDSATVTQ